MAHKSTNGPGQQNVTVPDDVAIRPALPTDIDVLHEFVVALARAEGHPETVTSTANSLQTALFSDRPVAEAVLAEVAGEPVGFALYYFAYSTVVGLPTLHLEDLYVAETHRGSGIGLQLLKHLARVAIDRDCGRFEWWVLRTNVAAIRFYDRIGARRLDEVDVMRMEGSAIREFASEWRSLTSWPLSVWVLLRGGSVFESALEFLLTH